MTKPLKCWLCGGIATAHDKRVLSGLVVHRGCDASVKRKKNISSGAGAWRRMIQKELNAKS